jgi:hypothetical protein
MAKARVFNGIIDRKRNTVDAVYMSFKKYTPDFGYALKCLPPKPTCAASMAGDC